MNEISSAGEFVRLNGTERFVCAVAFRIRGFPRIWQHHLLNCLRVSPAPNAFGAGAMRIAICSSLSLRSDWPSEESIQSEPSPEFIETQRR
jgi:hypothetical protein